MAYNTKPIVRDVDGNPISQYYNPTTDQYEPVEGSHGANKVLVENNELSLIAILDKLSQLTGTVIDEETRKSNELQRIDNEDTRQSNENIRNTNEIARVEDEEIRIQNENTRVQNENIRQTNEQDRVNLYNDLIDKVNSGYFDGKNLEFHWRGTELGVRVEGETEYIYVDLKGETGDIENLTMQHVINALGYTPIKSVNNMVADEAGNVELDIDTSEIENRIGNVEDDLVAHKAEDASQDNVHGLREDSIALGNNSSVSTRFCVAIGLQASATAFQAAFALGYNASANGNNSIALGSSATAESGSSIAIGDGSVADNSNYGVLGAYGTANKWVVPGDFTVEGTKNFEIPHPKPEKKATHRIRHGAVESPTAGDTLYRYKIQATKDNDKVLIDLPDYFVWLNKEVQIWVNGHEHFGRGFGKLNEETEQLEIHCENEGEYNVLVIGTRNDDHQSVQDWNIKGVEREIGESWTGETYAFSIDEIMEVEEIKEVS